MTVGVDERGDGIGPPGANRRHHLGTTTHPRGVETHQPVTGVPGQRVAETFDNRQTVREFGEFVGDAIDGLGSNAGVDDFC
ncbi:unannotated protein [freshwater metagenome]|uniref:Unannotated protein n=1 Tax=freshwater metagenome TaxID=449393 RepID=A0A6J6X0Z8_9ZZZZ